MSSSLKIALISPEISPLAKTGGLADMAASFGFSLKESGAEPFFVLPKYRGLKIEKLHWNEKKNQISIDGKLHPFRVGWGEGLHGIQVFVVDLPQFFDRKGLYGEAGRDYPDNCLRFAAFCMAVLKSLKELAISIDILHVHDWQTALIPVYLKALYAQDDFFQRMRTILTLHNLGYQGIFPAQDFRFTGLPEAYFSPQFLEFHRRLNLLKGGIVTADALTTVSPSYAEEILTAEWGFGLEGVLLERRDRLHGLLNGIEEREWDPSADPDLPFNFSSENLSGKEKCKENLQREFNLPVNSEIPLLAMVSRLVDQKGIDLILEIIPSFARNEAQWLILGTGDPLMEQALLRLTEAHPEKLAVQIGFDSALAHRITAGADFFLMPSRFEPCGYNQMYGMRYGTISIARATGGLKDTIKDIQRDPQGGTGILFANAAKEELHKAVLRALHLYEDKYRLNAIRARAMREDFSWRKSIGDYLELYQNILRTPLIPRLKTAESR